MRVSSVSSVTNYQKPTNRKLQNHHQVAFKSTQYEQEVEARTRQIIEEKKMSGWKQFWGGEAEARKQAEKEIDKKNRNNEIERVKAEAINEMNKKRIEESNDYMKRLEEQQRRNDTLMQEFKKTYADTVIIQQKAMETQKQAAESLQKQLKDYQSILKEQQELSAKREMEAEILLKKMEEAQRSQNEAIYAKFEKELAAMKAFYEAQIKAKAQAAEKVRNIEEIYQKINEIQENKGFGKLAGYQAEKDILMNLVGSSIILEKDGREVLVPNGILFFGPKGNGKTVFAQAFAEQLDCNLVNLENYLDSTENLKQLKRIATNAQQAYEKTGKRTIIQIDEFDDFAPKGDKIIGPLKVFMDEASKKYHCTVFATTNHPEKIDDILLRDGRFDVKVPLAPAKKNDALSILKFYGAKFADDTVDFEALANEVTKNQSELAYSNARLKAIVTNFIKTSNATKMTHKDFLASIKNITPDIKKDAIEKFKQQIEYIKRA